MKRILKWVGAAVVAGGVAWITLPDKPEDFTPSQSHEYVIYPSSQQTAIDALGIDFGQPRVHPDGKLRLVDKSGNIALTYEEYVALSQVDGVVIVQAEKIAEYLQENGWIVEGEH